MRHHCDSNGLAAAKSSLLTISVLIAGAAAQQTAVAQEWNKRQAEVDGALSVVGQAAGFGGADGPGFHIVDVSPDVRSAEVLRATVPPGPGRDIFIQVRASAQVGGLFLSMGGGSLVMNPASGFSIEVGGPGGLAVIPVVSGATAWHLALDCADAGQTRGFTASLSGTGVRIESLGLGSDQFVSVRMLQNIHRPQYFAGIYRLHPTNTGRANRASVIRFGTPLALTRQTDFGQDTAALIDRRPALSHGETLSLTQYDLYTTIRLTVGHATGPANAQSLGTFRAFTLVRD